MKRIVLLCILWGVCLSGLKAQGPQDIGGAIPLCGGGFVQDSPFYGYGQDMEINPNTACIGPGGELNGCWYKIQISEGGLLRFSVNPIGPPRNYDWALFNLTNLPNNAIYTIPPASCNSALQPLSTGCSGPNLGNMQLPGGQPWNSPVTVAPGETFYLFVAYADPNPQQTQYKIDLGGSTAQFFCADSSSGFIKCADNNTPNNLDSPKCGSEQPIKFSLTESVDCIGLNLDNFDLKGPGGMSIPLTSVEGIDCSGGYTATFEVVPAQPLPTAGSYQLKLLGGLMDGGGMNISNESAKMFVAPDMQRLRVLSTFRKNTSCQTCSNAKIVVAAVGGVGPYKFGLDNGPLQTSGVFNNLGPGTYSVKVKGGNGCTIVRKVTVF